MSPKFPFVRLYRGAERPCNRAAVPPDRHAVVMPESEPAAPIFDRDPPAAASVSTGGAASSISDPGPPHATGGLQTPVGPGLWESLLWIAGFFLLEIAGLGLWGAGMSRFRMLAGDAAPTPDDVQRFAQKLMPWILGSVKAVEVLATVLAIRLRFGRGAFRAAGFRPVPLPHAALLGLAIIPTAFLSGQCYALFQGYSDILAKELPFLKSLDEGSSIKSVAKMAAETPLAALVFIIAALPALNEEFLFRAAIGRGLVGRYGAVAGVSLTSMLFAAVHLSPAHAAALLPLAVLMHAGYLSSGSIWSCVGVHFLNNALSVALMKLATLGPKVAGISTDVAEAPFAPLLFVASAACVASTVWLLACMQVRWRLPDGRDWQPPVPSLEPPPPGLGAVPLVTGVSPAAMVTTAACYLLFPVAFAATALLHLR